MGTTADVDAQVAAPAAAPKAGKTKTKANAVEGEGQPVLTQQDVDAEVSKALAAFGGGG